LPRQRESNKTKLDQQIATNNAKRFAFSKLSAACRANQLLIISLIQSIKLWRSGRSWSLTKIIGWNTVPMFVV